MSTSAELLALLDEAAEAWEAYDAARGFRERSLGTDPRVSEMNAMDEEVERTQRAWEAAQGKVNDWLQDLQNLEVLRTALRRSGNP